MVISLRRFKSAFHSPVARFVALLFFMLLGGEFGKAQAAITLVQHTGKDGGTTTTSTLAFAGANTAGNWIAVSIRGGLSSSQVFTVTDSNGNTYKQAAQGGFTTSAVSLAIYYAENVKGGANTVTVSQTISGPLRFAIAEYSGVATASSLDGTAFATGVSTSATTANVTTTANGDLLLSAVATADAATFTAGSGYTIRDIVPAPPNAKFLTEDQIQASAGSATGSVSLAASGNWGIILIAVKAPGGVAGTPASITATAGTPQSGTVSTAFATQLQATVKDSFNNPVSGVTVTFAAPASGASGTFAGSVNTATTNAQGVATAPVFTANSTAGSYNVTASVSGVSTPTSFSLTNVAGAAASIAATAGTPQSVAINKPFATQFQATVRDSFNNPVSGVTVTFTAPASGASGTFAGSVNTATTNAQGVATAPVFTANSTAGGPYTVTASATGVSTSATFSLTNLAGTPASVTASAGTPQSATISTAFAAQMQATVLDAGSNPVSGVTVTFTAPASGASGTFAGGVNTATTNAQGVATAAVFTANSTAGGPYTVTASVTGVSTSATFSLTNLVGAPATVTATAGTPQSTSINTAFATQLQATVKDSGGNAVSGVTVTFTAPASGASGTFAGGVNTATTNAQGVATAAVFTANTTAGSDTVTASVSGVSTPANFSLTNLAGAAASIAATAGTPQSANINSAFAIPLQATVKDSFNNLVSGATVTFTAPASGASGTFAGGVNTATTNAQGVATAAVFTANATAGGPYSVTASVSGVSTSATFSLTNLAVAPSNITLVQHTSVDAGTTTSGTLAFGSVTTAGNWIAVCIRGGLSSSQVFTVKDSVGNTFKQAGQIGFTASAVTLAIYYAENIKGGADTITVSDSVSGPLRFAILEYSGVATASSLDVSAVATGVSTAAATGNVTTTTSGDLLLTAVATADSTTFTAGTGYTLRDFVPVPPNAKLATEDQIQATAGTTSGSVTLSSSSNWGVVLGAFKAASGGGGATTITATAGTPQSATINTAFATQLQATVKDSLNNPVSGVVVTFTAPASGASGTFAGGVNTATTNAQGVATAAVFTANSTAGSYTVTASATGATSATFSLTNTAGPAAKVTATSGSGQSAGVNTAFAATLAATVTDAGNNPISGVVVTFTAPASGASGTFANGTATTTATTNAQGLATSSTFTANATVGGPYNVTASATGATSANFSLTNLAGNPPTISNLSLTQGPVGANFTINGSNFGSSQGSSTIMLGTTSVTASSWSTLSINVTVPSGATTGNVVVTVNNVASNGALFTVTPPANITGIAPTSGPIGTNVVITGTNFGPTVGTIQSFVTFNGIQTRASNWTDTSITAPVPTGATTGNVLVNVGGVPSNPVVFTVTPPPSITSLSPTFGPVATSVTITGSNFAASQGTSTVTFNGVTASPTSWSTSSIVVPVPTGATSGNVVVTVSGVASNGVNFTVTSGSGNIALVQHTSIDAGTASSASLAFVSANAAGNFIAVGVRAGSTTSETFTISDTNGNTYRQAYQFAVTPSSIVFALYYAENIKGGANTITVSDTVSGPLRFAIIEYSGVATSNSLDTVPLTASGTSASPSSGNLTTGSNGDLLLGIVITPNGDTFTAGSGYTIRDFVPAEPGTKLITEDQIQAVAGTAAATASLSPSDNWGAGLAAFRSISGAGFPISVTLSPTSASVPSGYGTQAFTFTIANDFQNQGVTLSLSGAGCSGSTCGTLTNVTSSSVNYNAPASVPSPATVTLTATSVADHTKSASATITITQGVLHVTISPKRAAVTLSASQTIQFSDTVFNDTTNAGVTWQVDGNNLGNATTGTVTSSGLFTPGSQPGLHTVTAVSNANASVTASASVAVTDLAGVYTYHNDVGRTGQNVKEYGLTPSTVTSSTFGQLFSCPVDGNVYAQPLWVANLTVGSTSRNVVFIATEHDSVYAFDADSPSCVQLWKVSFLGTGVTTLSPSDINGNGDIVPEIGITSTPVIDPASNTLYVVPKTRETVGTVSGQACTTSAPCYVHRVHALDLATGTEKFGGPVVITATNFVPQKHLQRPALLLANSTLYIAFGSHGDQCTYQGWLMGYNPSTLGQVFAQPITNAQTNQGCNRGGIWNAGAGPAADSNGDVYVSTGNGTYDGVTNFGDTAVKLSSTGSVLDWFTPFNQSVFNANDIDLGSGGVIILPAAVGSTAHPNLAIATGKVAILYLLDIGTSTNNNTMGRFNSSSNNDVQEVIPVPPPNTTLLDGGNYAVPAYWNGNIYSTGQNFPLSQFQISNGAISTPQSAKSANTFPPRGGIPAVSANGTTGGVVWIIDYTGWQTGTAAILDAYDATNVGSLLFNSPSSGSGSVAPAVKFTVPTVANSKVYVGGQLSFSVFGLFPN